MDLLLLLLNNIRLLHDIFLKQIKHSLFKMYYLIVNILLFKDSNVYIMDIDEKGYMEQTILISGKCDLTGLAVTLNRYI